MKIFILLQLPFICFGQLRLVDLKPTKFDYAALSLGIVDGVAKGTLEALHADPKAVQNKFKLDPYQFGGSEDWQRNYKTNRYRDSEGNINPHKSELLGNFGRDMHHTAGDISKFSSRVGFGTFAIGAYIDLKTFKKKPLAVIAKGVIIWGISSMTEKLTYNYLR